MGWYESYIGDRLNKIWWWIWCGSHKNEKAELWASSFPVRMGGEMVRLPTGKEWDALNVLIKITIYLLSCAILSLPWHYSTVPNSAGGYQRKLVTLPPMVPKSKEHISHILFCFWNQAIHLCQRKSFQTFIRGFREEFARKEWISHPVRDDTCVRLVFHDFTRAVY